MSNNQALVTAKPRRTLIIFLQCTVLAHLLLAVSPFAGAAVTVYTDRSAWEAAVHSYVTENFNSVPVGPMSLGINSGGLVDIEIQGNAVRANRFSKTGGSWSVDGSTYYEGEVRYDTSPENSHSYPSVLFRNPIAAFGADWRQTNRNLRMRFDGYTVDFSDYLPFPGDGFLGVTSSTLFDRVDFYPEGDLGGVYTLNNIFSLDNLRFQALAVPPR